MPDLRGYQTGCCPHRKPTVTRRKTPPPPPTREEQRAADNVRPRGELVPSLCGMQRERPMFDRSRNCYVCAFRWSGNTTHCHLNEMCDRCNDETNPCDTTLQLRAAFKPLAHPSPCPCPLCTDDPAVEAHTVRYPGLADRARP